MSDGMICCFTGHRKLDPTRLEELSAVLDRVLDGLIREGVTTFRTGGAMGFDTLAALKILDRKANDPRLVLELCLPCRDQTRGWEDIHQGYYDNILQRADRVRYVGEYYTKTCMKERNRMLVDGSRFCVALCTKSVGGSAYTLRYAESRGLRVINLAGMLAQRETNY